MQYVFFRIKSDMTAINYKPQMIKIYFLCGYVISFLEVSFNEAIRYDKWSVI